MKPAMSCEDDHTTVFKDPRLLLFGVLYSVTCIVCIFVFVQRIRRRQRRRYVPFEGLMDLPPEKGGGEEPSDAASEEITYPAHTPYDSPPLPSACDILQPLSLYSPLPSSGYLAAVLARERRLRMDQDYQQGDQLNTNPDTKCSSGHRPAYTPSVAFGVNHSRQNSSSGPGSSSTEQSEEPLQATSPPTGGWTVEGQGLGPPSSPLSGEIQSVQRHNHGVEFLHEVDEEGVRTWRRWVVEYS